MRKGKWVCFIGLFIVITVILCNINKNNIYEKKVRFSRIDQIVEILNTKQLRALNKTGDFEVIANTDDFNECLSKRKRITYSSIYFTKLDVKNEEENNTLENKKRIINEYTNKTENIKGYEKPIKIDALTLTGKYYIEETYKYGGNIEGDTTIEIVFIDQGEGWVIDYFWITKDENAVNEYDSNK